MAAAAPTPSPRAGAHALAARTFDREVDTDWRRTSYSGLIRAAEDGRHTAGVTSEPEVRELDDEPEPADEELGADAAGGRRRRRAPGLADGRPARRAPTFGTLVHAVLEHADPAAPDLLAELRRTAAEQLRWWPAPVDADDLAAALVPCPAHAARSARPATSRWPRSPSPTGCASSTSSSRSVGGDHRDAASRPACSARRSPPLLRAHLPADDPLRRYADRLEAARTRRPAAARLPLRLDRRRAPSARRPTGHRFVVVDYKTNRSAARGAGDHRRLRARPRWPRPCCTRTTRCRRCSTPSCCTGSCAGGCPATTPPPTSAACSTSSCAACAAPTRPRPDGVPTGVFSWQPPAGAGRRALRPARREGVMEPCPAPCSSCFETDDPHDRRLAHGATGLLRDFNRAGVLDRRRRPRRAAARRRRSARPTRPCGSPWRSPCAPCAARVGVRRPGAGWPRLDPVAALAGPRGLARRASPPARWSAACGAPRRRRPALPRPLLARGGPGARRPARPGRRSPRRSLDAAVPRGAARAGLPGHGSRRAARRRAPGRRSPLDHRAHRRARHRQDHDGRRPARPAGRASRRDRRCGSPSPHRPARRRPGCRRPCADEAAGAAAPRTGDPVGRARRAADPAPAARLAARQPAPGSGTTATTGCPHDVVVVDETSMVSLTMMARLLEAIRPDARLVLVGDPDQLASVEAGAVLADLVDGLGDRAGDGAVARPASPPTASASRDRRPRRRRCATATPDAVLDAARARATTRSSLVDPGDATALAAVRDRRWLRPRPGRAGPRRWPATRRPRWQALERAPAAVRPPRGPLRRGALEPHRSSAWLGEATGAPVGGGWGRSGTSAARCWSPANDYGLGLFNGDTGVVVRDGRRGCAPSSPAPTATATSPSSRLADVETMHAMTVHKSQGSQAERGDGAAAARGLAAADPRALLHRGDPRPARSSASSAPRRRSARRVSRRAQRASGLARRVAPG